MQLHELLRNEMLNQGHSQYEVRMMSKLSAHTLRMLLSGNEKARLSDYHELANVLGVKVKFTLEIK